MKLTETKDVISGKAMLLRAVCGLVVVMMATGAALSFHVRPTFASVLNASSVLNFPSSLSAPANMVDAQTAAPASTQAVPARATQTKPAGTSGASVVIEPVQTENTAGASSPPAKEESDGPTVTVGKGSYAHHWIGADGRRYVVANGNPNEPSAGERLTEEKKLQDALQQLDKIQGELNESKLDLQVKELQRTVDRAEMKAQIEAAKKFANDPAMKLRMDEMEKELSRLEALSELKKFSDPEWQKQFADLQKNPPKFEFNFDFDKQIALANSAMNDARLQETIRNAMKSNEEGMAKMQKEIEKGGLKQKLDEATRLLDEVRKEMQAKE